MELRQEKGLLIAATAKLQQHGDRWFVPSHSNRDHTTYYIVKPDPADPHCTCPDHQNTKARCKHIFAVEFAIKGQTIIDDEQGAVVEPPPPIKKTYRQQWPAYNKAQTQEKDQFQGLLHELCKGIGEPSQKMGRPRLPFEDMIFAATFKVYSTVSGRRFMSDLRDAHSKGHISKVPCYNSIFNYFEDEMLTPYLKMLIEESALPLQAVECDFAVDSSGFSTSRFFQWVDAKYTNPTLVDKRDWVKVHLMCGVKTNIVTAVEISEKYAHDSPFFVPLVETTSQNFTMQEVSADKAYSSAKNLKMVLSKAAMPYIAFRGNAKGGLSRDGGSVWKRMYHYYQYNQEWFMQHYHKRSNVETTFSMIKAKFGDGLRSRTKVAQINEALCKILCHNLCCLIQSMFELKIQPEFWSEVSA
jgi:transposase